MSIARGKFERRTILDFSQGKFSKNHIMKALRQVEVLERMETQDDITFIDNRIQVGMYQICIIPSSIVRGRRSKLRDYGPFTIEIMETQNDGIRPINCEKDYRFKEQNWAPIAYTYNVRIKHLLDIILYCNKLDNLRAFL